MNIHRPCQKASGFTLVELLVVVVIVAILALFLLPALSLAKAKSQSIYCVNSLKQMSLASSLYVEDNSGYFPWTYSLEGSQLKRETWFTYLEPYQPSKRLWLCPVRPDTLPLAPIRSAGLFQRSQEGEIVYPSNGQVVNYAANFGLGGCFYQGIPPISPLKESAVRGGETKVQICDSGSQATVTTEPGAAVTPNSPPKDGAFILADPSSPLGDSAKAATDDPNWCGPQLRHLDNANVLFLDGHAETRGSKWYYADSPWLKVDGTTR